jgi:ABC-type glycerol-3-phosphate transport system substrate-binding protein
MKSSVFQVVLISVFGAIAVAGVLIFAFAVGGGGANSVGTVRIWGTFNEAAVAAVLRQFAENNPTLSQVTYEQKDPATYERDVTQALASGTGPDLFIMRHDYAFQQSALVIPIPFDSLSENQFRSTFVDAALPYLASEGVVAVPLLADPLVLYWNRDMLATAGFAKPPVYWDEVYPMALAITRRDDSGRIQRSAIAFGEYENIANAKDILSLLIMQAGGRITERDSAGNLIAALSPKAGDVSQSSLSALRFYTEFADPSKGDYSWNRSLPDAREAFAAGDVALYVGYASEQPLMERINPNLNFAVSPVPQVRDARATINTGRVYGLAIPRVSTNPAGALTVAFTLVSNEISKTLSTAVGIPSARRDVLAEQAAGIEDLYNKQVIIMRSWTDPNPERTSNLFRAMIEDTVSGASLVTEAVTRGDQELSQILGI